MNRRLLIAGSVRTFMRYRMRSFFMGLGIVIGVAGLVVMRSMGAGAEQEMLDRMDRMFSASSIFVLNTGRVMGGGRRAPGQLTIEDFEAVADQLEQVIDWNPSVTAMDQEVQYRGQSRRLMIVGDSERAGRVSGRGVTEGEFFSASDIRASARVALLGGKTAEALFGDERPVGKQIRIGSAPFRVKGVLAEQGIDPHGLNRDDEVHIPITTIMSRLLNVEVIDSAKLLVTSPGEVDETADRVADILRARHRLAEDEPDDFAIYTPVYVREAVREANRVLTIYLPATAGIALLVAAIVISNIMLISIRERIAEIGLRKAVGATDRQISGQFLLESVAVTAISGLIGVGLGVGVLQVIARTFYPEAAITPDSIVLGLTAALVVGVLAGSLPARQAARLQPVDALR